MKILMVCLGNICRSPLAQGILEAKIKSLGLDWIVDSAGTSGYHNDELPDIRSIEIAKYHGLDISNQRSRKINENDFEIFDLIFAMDQSNFRNIKKLGRTLDESKLHLIMNMVNSDNQPVPDPYYNDGFPKVYKMLDEACDAILDRFNILL